MNKQDKVPYEDNIYRIMCKEVITNSKLGGEVTIWLQIPVEGSSISYLDEQGHLNSYLKYKHLWSFKNEKLLDTCVRQVIALRSSPNWYYVEYALSFEDLTKLRTSYINNFNPSEENIVFRLTVK